MYKFPDNSTVCFVGDSITAAFNYEAIIANYYIENLRSSNIRIYNCGVAGGTAKSQLEYLTDDTLCHNPTHVVITLGVNDSQRWAFEESEGMERYKRLTDAYEDYKINLPRLCDELEGHNIKIILCTPPPYAEYQNTSEPAYKGGYALILGYAAFVRELAKERDYPLCDYHKYLTEIMQREDLYVEDHVHLTDNGHYYMAKCFLEFQGYELNEQKPLSEDFKKLIEASGVLRDIYAAELMIIGEYKLSIDEKLKIVQRFLDNGEARDEYFFGIANNYIANKVKMNEYEDIVEYLTTKLMG